MEKTKRKRSIQIGSVAIVVMLVCFLAACSAPSQESTQPAPIASEEASIEPIISAAHWKDQYPEQYESYVAAGHATYAHSPGASGKVNAHLDVFDPPADYPAPFMTGCLSCHASGYQSIVMDGLGDELFTTDTEVVKEMIDEGITCYSCHGNTPGEMNPVNQWVLDAAEKGGIQTSDENMVCAQCHSMGDFSVQFSDTDSSKWSLLQVGVDPDAVWNYIASNENYTPIVPTAETVFNNFLGSTHDTAGATCVDCHMQTETSDDGKSYTKHIWQSVGVNEGMYENCSACHTDTAADRKEAVASVQADFAVSASAAQVEIDALTKKIEEATAAGIVPADDIEAATLLKNKAVFYLSYGSDQSNGIHGMGEPSTKKCHETARQTAVEGLALLA